MHEDNTKGEIPRNPALCEGKNHNIIFYHAQGEVSSEAI